MVVSAGETSVSPAASELEFELIVLAECNRHRFDALSSLWTQRLERLQNFRMSHAAAEIGPAVGFLLDVTKLFLLTVSKVTSRRIHPTRHVKPNLLGQSAIDKTTDREILIAP